jgi:hypothetical protein
VHRDTVIAVPCYSARRSRGGFLKRSYTPDEVDAVAAYCPDLDRCYFLPLELFGTRTYIQLRLKPTGNNQKLGVHWADRYEFAATLGARTWP